MFVYIINVDLSYLPLASYAPVSLPCIALWINSTYIDKWGSGASTCIELKKVEKKNSVPYVWWINISNSFVQETKGVGGIYRACNSTNTGTDGCSCSPGIFRITSNCNISYSAKCPKYVRKFYTVINLLEIFGFFWFYVFFGAFVLISTLPHQRLQ